MTETPKEDFEADLLADLNDQENDQADEIEINLDALDDDAEPQSQEPEINLDFGDDEETESSDEVATESEPEIDLSVLDDEEQQQEETAKNAAAQAAEQALASELDKLRDELEMKPGDWYVVHTYSGMENRVRQNIEARIVNFNMEDYIYEVVVPTEDAIEMRNGQRKNVTRTFMPGYVLVRMEMTDDAWSTVRHTPSVTGIVGYENQPVPLTLDEVVNMMTPLVAARIAAETSARTQKMQEVLVADYQVGDSVMVVDGPFAGVHATITEINVHSQRVKANVEILGRETPVDLTFPQIQRVI